MKLLRLRHPLALGSFINWMRLLFANKGVDQNFGKALYVSITTLLLTPIRIFEDLSIAKKIENVEIKEPPIFIIGHWRSGTTYLHRLMSRGTNLGYISGIQTFAPEAFLTISKLIRGIKTPQEEEFGISNMSLYSYYHGLYFQRNARELFRKYVLFEGVSEDLRSEWKEIFLKLLKKTYISMNGNKKLVLKNPTNTGRIKLLLEIFPNAKFIHIYRNPYTVYSSIKGKTEMIIRDWAFQKLTEEETEENIFFFYREVMRRFFEEQKLIPHGNFVEISYEDLESKPLEQIEKIYTELNLPGFEESQQNFKSYIVSQASHKKNKHILNDKTITKIYNHWKFTIDKWKYEVPDDLE